MKRLVVICACALFLSSCSPSTLLLKGEYANGNYSMKTSKDKDSIWENIIDWFFDQQLSISLIDKESGIIASGTISLLPQSAEERYGKPSNPEAYCVVAADPYYLWPNYVGNVAGSIMARVRQDDDSTIVSVQLANLECRNSSNRYIEVKSTGVLEKKLLKQMIDGKQ